MARIPGTIAVLGAQLIAQLKSEKGSSLIETTIACCLLITVTIGLLGLAAVASTLTENQGHLAARTTEYAQDKMEQLLAIAYTDAGTNTVTFPATATGGTGLAIGGSLDEAAPENGYVDWLAQDGTLLGGGTTPPDTWFYQRLWAISQLSAGVKQITVTSTVRHSVARSLLPRSTVVALKGAQF